MLMANELSNWLAVWRIPGIGPATFAKLLGYFPNLTGLLEATPSNLIALGISQKIIASLQRPDWQAVDKDLRWAEQAGCTIVTCQDAAYPALLQQVSAAPPLLFVQGQLEVLNLPQLAMVGSRNPSSAGKELAYQFAHFLAQHGMTISSGLALGVDAASHCGALAAQGKTIAVMGTGLDTIYPANHRELAAQIIEQGALVSEFPIGVGVKAEHFPRRNRIISGLSRGVLVVEAALKSGSLITARYALEQNREIFAIPGSIHNPLAKGCHALIRQGAKLVETAADILDELSGVLQLSRAKQTMSTIVTSTKVIAAEQAAILALVDFSATPVDMIVERSGLTVDAVSSMLLMLELDNFIMAIPGGYIRTATCPI